MPFMTYMETMRTTREQILAHLKRSPGASVETLARERRGLNLHGQRRAVAVS